MSVEIDAVIIGDVICRRTREEKKKKKKNEHGGRGNCVDVHLFRLKMFSTFPPSV